MRSLAVVIAASVSAALPRVSAGQEPQPPLVLPYSYTHNVGDVEHQAPLVPEGFAFDWVVSIGKKGFNHALGGHFCGGSVIGKRWVLTAAHCLFTPDAQGQFIPVAKDKIQIRTGYELHRLGQTYKVEKILIHENYNVTPFRTLINDIALLKADKDIVTHGAIAVLRPVNVASIEERLTVLGWGKPAAHRNYLSERLRYLSLTVVKNDSCNQNYYTGLIDDKMICAVGDGTDACQGDSGGPLVASDADGNLALYGIVSWGEQCGATLKPGIYASVPQFVAWIEEKLRTQ